MGSLNDQVDDHAPQPPLTFSTRTLGELNSQRADLVHAVLSARGACQKANTIAELEPRQAEKAQLVLSTAVRALEEFDNQLAKIKDNSTSH